YLFLSQSHLISFLFFLFMIPPPPTSTLFPYTTLFRSESLRDPSTAPSLPALRDRSGWLRMTGGWRYSRRQLELCYTAFLKQLQRSEEHTSELQSRFDLVCRLLLEKKKK